LLLKAIKEKEITEKEGFGREKSLKKKQKSLEKTKPLKSLERKDVKY